MLPSILFIYLYRRSIQDDEQTERNHNFSATSGDLIYDKTKAQCLHVSQVQF
jgi:hypothetical protein